MITDKEFIKLQPGDLVCMADFRLHQLHPLHYPDGSAVGVVRAADYDFNAVLVQWPNESSCKGAKQWMPKSKLKIIEHLGG